MRSLRVLICLAGVMLLVGCDHTTKSLAKTHLEGRGALELLPGVLDLRYAENSDSAFSLLGSLLPAEARFLVLSVLGGAALVAMAVFVLQNFRRLGAVGRAGAALVLGGAIGNLSDRLLRGYVVDFVHLHRWPVFNVADIALCVGGALLVWSGARTAASHRAAAQINGSAEPP